MDAAISVFRSGNAEAAKQIEPLEEAIDILQKEIDEETYAHEYIDSIPRGKGSAFDKTVQECLKRYEL